MQKSATKKLALMAFALTIISLSLLFCSCSGVIKNQNSGLCVQDIYGRQVDIPDNVEKIATVGSAARIVVYAGAQDKLTAVTEMEKKSEQRPYTLAYSDIFEKLPSTNNGNHLNQTDVDKEKMLEINPDVILSTRSADECQQLQESTKIPVVGVYYQDEIYDDSLIKSIEITGKVADTSQHTEKITSYLKESIKDLENRCAGKSSQKLYRGAVNFKGSKGLLGTISNYKVYKPIYANNVADKQEITGAYDTTVEQLYSWNPEIIFIDSTNIAKVKNDYADQKNNLQNISAFKNKQIYCVAPFNNNGTNIECGLCEAYYTGKILYPDSFKDIDIDKKFTEIFSTILGKDIYQQLKDNGVYFGKVEL